MAFGILSCRRRLLQLLFGLLLVQDVRLEHFLVVFQALREQICQAFLDFLFLRRLFHILAVLEEGGGVVATDLGAGRLDGLFDLVLQFFLGVLSGRGDDVVGVLQLALLLIQRLLLLHKCHAIVYWQKCHEILLVVHFYHEFILGIEFLLCEAIVTHVLVLCGTFEVPNSCCSFAEERRGEGRGHLLRVIDLIKGEFFLFIMFIHEIKHYLAIVAPVLLLILINLRLYLLILLRLRHLHALVGANNWELFVEAGLVVVHHVKYFVREAVELGEDVVHFFGKDAALARLFHADFDVFDVREGLIDQVDGHHALLGILLVHACRENAIVNFFDIKLVNLEWISDLAAIHLNLVSGFEFGRDLNLLRLLILLLILIRIKIVLVGENELQLFRHFLF